MTDREEVMTELNGLQLWLKGQVILVPGHEDWQNALKVCTNALDLLKEQGAVRPEREYSGGGVTWWYVCGNCKTAINPNDKFCHECGREVKWSG